jgi:hypothetical protein
VTVVPTSVWNPSGGQSIQARGPACAGAHERIVTATPSMIRGRIAVENLCRTLILHLLVYRLCDTGESVALQRLPAGYSFNGI